MELIPVPCDHDAYITVDIARWLYENVGPIATEKALVNQDNPWCVHHYVMVPSVYWFINEQDAVLFALKFGG